MLALDLVNTVAVAGVVLFAGYGLRRAIPLLARLNLPAPVVGGLVVAIAMTVAHSRGVQLVRFDTTLQTPLQNAFFTSIGFGASYQLLRLGGPLVLRFFIFAASVAILQNVVGAAVALALGQEPLLGVLAGSVTLTGGPAGSMLSFVGQPFFYDPASAIYCSTSSCQRSRMRGSPRFFSTRRPLVPSVAASPSAAPLAFQMSPAL